MGDISRRKFVRAGLAGVTSTATAHPLFGQGPAVINRGVRPVVIASANGNRFKNGGPSTCVEQAFHLLTSGTDVLDALIAGVNIVERDP